jgi:predicted PolB exonuclease-like 3'-5' exonuclease
MTDKPAYLVLDLESVVDGRLVQLVRYHDEPGLTPAEAVAKYRALLREQTGGKSDFVPGTFHVPVSVAVAKVSASYELLGLTTLDRPKFRPQVISRAFWKGWVKHNQPTLVTFNGRGFDLPVLELAAMRYGISVPQWFNAAGNQYQQPRNRFNTAAHLDLQDFFSNQGAMQLNGGLNLMARLVGGAGKMHTQGDMVQELWERGERERIDDYCQTDVLDTYLLFLRSRVMLGLIDTERERQLYDQARALIDQLSTHSLALQEYLRHMRPALVPGDDDDVFAP